MARSTPRAPTAPPGFDPRVAFDGIRWYQRWEVFDGIFTPGDHSIADMCDDLELPADLSGRRVLDIGAWDGAVSFECERRGAREVVAVGPEDPAQSGFSRLRDVVGSTRTVYRVGSVYDLDPTVLGRFDLVVFCGVLYHLRYPLLGIDNLRRVASGDVLVETYVTDQPRGVYSWLRRGATAVDRRAPLWLFFRGEELGGDASNWFGPNVEAVEQAFESAGFSIRRLRLGTGARRSRATFAARVRPGCPEFLVNGSTEGAYFDTVVGRLLGTRSEWLNEDGSLLQALVDALVADGAPLDHAAWASAVCQRLLGRRVEAAELDHILPQRANDSAARQARVRELASTRESLSHFVAACYTRFLRRVASPAEINDWVERLRRWTDLEDTVVAFVCSPEYALQAGSVDRIWFERAHTDLFGRPPDAAASRDALPNVALNRRAVISELARRPECQRRLIATLYPLRPAS
jgi:tRNA (mo5U34)-methyltransferase